MGVHRLQGPGCHPCRELTGAVYCLPWLVCTNRKVSNLTASFRGRWRSRAGSQAGPCNAHRADHSTNSEREKRAIATPVCQSDLRMN